MFRNLLAEMAREGIEIKDLALKIGISAKSLGFKLHCKTEFTRKEMMKIKRTFNNRYTLEYLFELPEDEEAA